MLTIFTLSRGFCVIHTCFRTCLNSIQFSFIHTIQFWQTIILFTWQRQENSRDCLSHTILWKYVCSVQRTSRFQVGHCSGQKQKQRQVINKLDLLKLSKHLHLFLRNVLTPHFTSFTSLLCNNFQASRSMLRSNPCLMLSIVCDKYLLSWP